MCDNCRDGKQWIHFHFTGCSFLSSEDFITDGISSQFDGCSTDVQACYRESRRPTTGKVEGEGTADEMCGRFPVGSSAETDRKTTS